jgi:hypothetical protein
MSGDSKQDWVVEKKSIKNNGEGSSSFAYEMWIFALNLRSSNL